MGLSDSQAYELTKRASPDLTEPERHFGLQIARVETNYGNAWTGDAVGSNNWGAVQGTGPAGYFIHQDTHADGRTYTTKFKKYNSPEEGWLDVVRYALKPNVRQVLNAPAHDAMKALDVMRNVNHYFELKLSSYQARVAKSYASFIKNTGLPAAMSVAGVTAAAGGGGLITSAITAVILYKIADWVISKVLTNGR